MKKVGSLLYNHDNCPDLNQKTEMACKIMMNELSISIEFPIVPVRHFEEQFLNDIQDRCLTDLLSQNKELACSLKEYGEHAVIILKKQDIVNRFEKSDNLCFSINIDLLKLEELSELNKKAINDDRINDEETVLITIEDIADEFANEVFFIIATTQIAYPGSLGLRNGEININGTKIKETFGVSVELRAMRQSIKKINWPPLKSLSFNESFEWVKGFHKNDLSNSAIQRAFNSFTYLFSENQSLVEPLIYSLVGLEALYCTSKQGISEQITERTQIVLGHMIDFKKRLKEMYSFRSDFLHGKLDFYSLHSQINNERTEEFSKKLFESEELATAILIATFQEMIQRNIYELNFKTVLTY